MVHLLRFIALERLLLFEWLLRFGGASDVGVT
jgi:hypothetical protein